MKTKTLFPLALLLFFSYQISAQLTSLDSTFSADGIAITHPGTAGSFASAVAVQLDGKAIVVGDAASGASSVVTLVRYSVEGEPDSTFGGGGIVLSDFGFVTQTVRDVALDTDEKIFVAGTVNTGTSLEFFVAKYLSNGFPDISFGGGIRQTAFGMGFISFEFTSIALQPDGKILLAGYYADASPLIARLNADGSPDLSFDGDGYWMGISSNFRIYEIAVQPDGKIVVGGTSPGEFSASKPFIYRINEDGSDDPSFASGIVEEVPAGASGVSLQLQPDGKIVMGGTYFGSPTKDFILLRYTSAGSLDSSFHSDGMVFASVEGYSSHLSRITLQPDGKIVAGGSIYTGTRSDFGLARFLPDGSPDNAFSSDGVEITYMGSKDNFVEDAEMTPDGKIILVGYSDDGPDFYFAATRYLSGLTIGVDDFATVDGQLLVYPNPATESITISSTSNLEEIVLLNSLGQIVMQMDGNGRKEKQINLAVLPAGLYLVSVRGEGGTAVKRLVVK